MRTRPILDLLQVHILYRWVLRTFRKSLRLSVGVQVGGDLLSEPNRAARYAQSPLRDSPSSGAGDPGDESVRMQMAKQQRHRGGMFLQGSRLASQPLELDELSSNFCVAQTTHPGLTCRKGFECDAPRIERARHLTAKRFLNSGLTFRAPP